MEHVIPTFVKFYQQEDYHKVFGNFQQINIKGKEEHEWIYTTTKIYHSLDAGISLSIPIKQMGNLGKQLTGLLEDNLFIKKNYQRFASLTKQECLILKMIVAGLKTTTHCGSNYASHCTPTTHIERTFARSSKRNLWQS